MKKAAFIFLLLMFILSACSTESGPVIPDDPPTQEELEDLLGDWEGLTETSTGLLDQINLTFYSYHDNIFATVYLNNTYVDEVSVDYDGDRVFFFSYDLQGEYGEFDGIIDHVNLIFSGSFLVQSGISTREGTFVIYKLSS